MHSKRESAAAEALQYTVDLTNAFRWQRTIAAFDSITEAINYADLLAHRLHDQGSRQTVNVWDERTNLRVHVIYAPIAEAA